MAVGELENVEVAVDEGEDAEEGEGVTRERHGHERDDVDELVDVDGAPERLQSEASRSEPLTRTCSRLR